MYKMVAETVNSFPDSDIGMGAYGAQLQLYVAAALPGIQRGCEGDIERRVRGKLPYLFGLLKGDDIEASAVLGDAKFGVLTLLPQAAQGRGHTDAVGAEQGRWIARAVRGQRIELLDQGTGHSLEPDCGVDMQRRL